MQIDSQVADLSFSAGIVVAEDVLVGPTPDALKDLLDGLVRRRSAEDFPPPAVKDAVRRLLKRGGFKPSGRNKPASEYLAQAAREGRFPRINNLVDINNLLSLETGLPISLLDLAAFGGKASLRCGQPSEKYIFNSAGQEIDLEGLICACSAEDAPLGNPVKDSMAGKLKTETTGVLGVIYAPLDCEAGKNLAASTERFGQLLKEFGGAAKAMTFTIPPAA